MKSIFDDIFLINKFEKIIKSAQQLTIDFATLNSGVDELFKNLRSQLVFTQESDKNTLDVFTDLKNLESFLLFLYQNQVKYKGTDIVGTYGVGIGVGEYREPEVDYSDKPPPGYVRYEREKKYQINVNGIWAYLDNLKSVSQVNNPKAIPYIDNIIAQLQQVTPHAGVPATTPAAAGATEAAAPSATAPSSGTAGIAAGVTGGLGESQKKALSNLIAMANNNDGPLYNDRIDFGKIRLYIDNYVKLIPTQSDLQSNFNYFYDNIYQNLSLAGPAEGKIFMINNDNVINTAMERAAQVYNYPGAMDAKYIAIKTNLSETINQILVYLQYLQDNYLKDAKFKGYFLTQRNNGNSNIRSINLIKLYSHTPRP